ncbi:hypothetical protein WDU94_006586, partial [Cyamophila willieti]
KLVGQSDLRVPTAMGSVTPLTILQGNAGGLTASKRIELDKTLADNDIDMFCIMEANLTHDSLNFIIPGYTLHLLPKFRQIASGILVGVKSVLMSTFIIIKEMNNGDKIKITKTDVWKNNEHYKIYSCYNPPTNTPNLSQINIETKTIVIGDFNAHSPMWGYLDQNSPGREVEDFLNTHAMELIYRDTDLPTFLHYSGSCTNPDFCLCHLT